MNTRDIINYEFALDDIETIIAVLTVADKAFLSADIADYSDSEKREALGFIHSALQRFKDFHDKLTYNELLATGIAFDFADRILNGYVSVDSASLEICNKYYASIRRLSPVFFKAFFE
ncbi:MAG: hypothetical protein IKF59_04470 [Lachnospiraceae bacterium]|nr:hypothetical protein [Lachnospiraceae bacterium]